MHWFSCLLTIPFGKDLLLGRRFLLNLILILIKKVIEWLFCWMEYSRLLYILLITQIPNYHETNKRNFLRSILRKIAKHSTVCILRLKKKCTKFSLKMIVVWNFCTDTCSHYRYSIMQSVEIPETKWYF